MEDDVKVLIVDDHTIMRDGLMAMLSSEPGYTVVGYAADGTSAVSAVEKLKPDLVLMDLAMPGMGGIEATRVIKRKWPNVLVIALTFHKEDRYIAGALRAGVSGYVLKDDSREELFSSLDCVKKGKTYLSPSIVDRVVSGFLAEEGTDARTALDLLTTREREVIGLIAQGLKTKEIAAKLMLSPKTVEKHRANLMKKLDLHSASAISVYAIQNGLVA